MVSRSDKIKGRYDVDRRDDYDSEDDMRRRQEPEEPIKN